MRTTFADQLADLRQRRQAFDAVFALYACQVVGADDLQEQAHKALAREALWRACRSLDRRQFDPDEVDALADFASETYPQAPSLLEHRGLAWRLRAGPDWCARARPLLPGTYLHKVRDALWWRRWRASGV